MTLAELRTSVKNLLGEQTLDGSDVPIAEESPYWSDAELKRYINDAYVEACRETKALEFEEEIVSDPLTNTYEMTANVGSITRVSHNSRKVYSTTRWELNRSVYDWASATGQPEAYFRTSYLGSHVIVVYPGPSSDDYPIVIWATKNPDMLSADGDEPELPSWCHFGIALRAAAKAKRKYGEQRGVELATAYDAMAAGYLSLLRGIVANKSTERVIAMSGRPRDRRRPKPWDEEIVD